MARYFGARGGGAPSAGEGDRARQRNQAARCRVAALSDTQKTRTLGRAIATAAASRGAVTLDDLKQSGISEADSKRLYEDAFAFARTIDPQLDHLGALP